MSNNGIILLPLARLFLEGEITKDQFKENFAVSTRGYELQLDSDGIQVFLRYSTSTNYRGRTVIVNIADDFRERGLNSEECLGTIREQAERIVDRISRLS